MAAKKKTGKVTKTVRKPAARGPSKAPDKVYEIEIRLLWSEPRVWRRFAVPAKMTLATLHNVVQIVMGWWEEHLHQFTAKDKKRYAVPYPGMDFGYDEDLIDSQRVKLCDVAKRRGARFLYEYDFGDSWKHTLEVVKTGPPESGVRYPVCLAGERACPPEDCGGVYGYAELLQTISDPKHPDRGDMLEWLGEGFDPEAFDLAKVNRKLKNIR